MSNNQFKDPTTTYRPDIDGIRAIAVTFVVLFHAQVSFLKSGFIGVDIFFVISGFLIGGIILKGAQDGSFSYMTFYSRRLRRILPALMTVVIATLVIGLIILSSSELRRLAATGFSALAATSNISFWKFQDYFNSDSAQFPFLMTWSLGVEEQFYIVFPVIMLAIVKWAPKHIMTALSIIVVASFLVSICWTLNYPSAAFYLLPSRAWELGIGAVLAAAQSRPYDDALKSFKIDPNILKNCASITGFALLIWAATGFSPQSPFPGWIALLPVAGTCLLILSEGSLLNRRLLSLKPIVFVGSLSYSWYLWHWPLLSFAHIIIPGDVPKRLSLLLVFVALIVAFLSWKFIEQPFRRRVLEAKKVVPLYAITLVSALCVLALVKYMDGIPERLSPEARSVEETLASGRGNCLVTYGIAQLPKQAECSTQTNAPSRVMLIGDSHAAAFGPGLRDIAKDQHFDITIWTKSSCGPMLGVSITSDSRPDFPALCNEFVKMAVDAINKDPSVKVVLLGGYWDSYYDQLGDNEFRKGLANLVHALEVTGKEVVVVEDVPEWVLNPAQLELNRTIAARRSLYEVFNRAYPSFSHPPYYKLQKVPVNDAIISTLKASNARYFTTTKNLCPSGICVYQSEGLDYIDRHHLSKNGSKAALKGLIL
jgi:peptidoglycan/LPS O-acetylase OafA/YrhL